MDKTLEVVEAQLLPSSQILLATPPSDSFSRSSVLELPPVTASSLTISVVHVIVQTEICPLCMYSRRNEGEGYCVGHGSVQKTGSSLSLAIVISEVFNHGNRVLENYFLNSVAWPSGFPSPQF